jgi:hypothetical protein
MDFKNAYEWGRIFASPWEELCKRMGVRANTLGFTQEASDQEIIWQSEDGLKIKFCFVQDPSDIEDIRQVFNDDQNISVSMCFIVVKQPDPSDKRGDIIFDIFRMNSKSYLWHFNRVYTPTQ